MVCICRNIKGDQPRDLHVAVRLSISNGQLFETGSTDFEVIGCVSCRCLGQNTCVFQVRYLTYGQFWRVPVVKRWGHRAVHSVVLVILQANL